MKEIWKDIDGFEGLYKVSSFGNVKSLERIVHCKNGRSIKVNKRQLKKAIVNTDDKVHYYMNTLSKDNKVKHILLHRLVAVHFIPNPNNLPEVNHKDGDGFNCLVNNLEWTSGRENITHSKLTGKKSSKFTGLSIKNNRWRVRLNINKKEIYIGSFKSEEEASMAYKKAMLKYGIENKYAKVV